MIEKTCKTRGPITIHPCCHPVQIPGCIHLPVAPACNMECRFCTRSFDHEEETRAGGIPVVVSHDQAVESIQTLMNRGERIESVIVSGPGEPLANAATFLVMRRIHSQFPGLSLGISTNGLLLRDRMEQVVAAGISRIAITVNAFLPETAKKIHSRILYKGRRYPIEEIAEFVINSQWQGLALASDAALDVTVTTCLIPGINEAELPSIAERARTLGTHRMNIVPFFPQHQLAHHPAPDREAVAEMRRRCGQWLPQVE